MDCLPIQKTLSRPSEKEPQKLLPWQESVPEFRRINWSGAST